MKDDESLSGIAKLGIAGAIGFGALATGLFLSRRGRHLVREALEGRRRTTLEDSVLDALWGERRLNRRRLDVQEMEGGVIAVSGTVRTAEERARAIAVAEAVRGVSDVVDRLELEEAGAAGGRLRSLTRS